MAVSTRDAFEMTCLPRHALEETELMALRLLVNVNAQVRNTSRPTTKSPTHFEPLAEQHAATKEILNNNHCHRLIKRICLRYWCAAFF